MKNFSLPVGTYLRQETGYVSVENLHFYMSLRSTNDKYSEVISLKRTREQIYTLKFRYSDDTLRCTANTLLTVRGCTPMIYSIKGKFYFFYSIRGNEFSSTFQSYADVLRYQQFLNLYEDIYQISVEEILLRRPRHIYLYTHSVSYPKCQLTEPLEDPLETTKISMTYLYNEPAVIDATLDRFFGDNTSEHYFTNKFLLEQIQEMALSRGYAIFRHQNCLQLHRDYFMATPFDIIEGDFEDCVELTLKGDGRVLLRNYFLVGTENN